MRERGSVREYVGGTERGRASETDDEKWSALKTVRREEEEREVWRVEALSCRDGKINK